MGCPHIQHTALAFLSLSHAILRTYGQRDALPISLCPLYSDRYMTASAVIITSSHALSVREDPRVYLSAAVRHGTPSPVINPPGSGRYPLPLFFGKSCFREDTPMHKNSGSCQPPRRHRLYRAIGMRGREKSQATVQQKTDAVRLNVRRPSKKVFK